MSRQRRSRRAAPRGRTFGLQLTAAAFGPEPGPGVVTASIEELEEAIRRQPDRLDWDSVADQVIPVMPRVRPYPSGFPAPMRVLVDPGVAVGYAIDVGPGFANVGADLLRSWGVSLAEVQARSLANVLGRCASVRADAIVEGSLDGTPTRWLQTGQSIGSVLVLVPDELRRIFGPRPAYFITPMRDLIIGLPADVDRELAAWLWLEIAVLDPNCLPPIGYRFDGYTVRPEPLDDLIGTDLDIDADPGGTAYVA